MLTFEASSTGTWRAGTRWVIEARQMRASVTVFVAHDLHTGWYAGPFDSLNEAVAAVEKRARARCRIAK